MIYLLLKSTNKQNVISYIFVNVYDAVKQPCINGVSMMFFRSKHEMYKVHKSIYFFFLKYSTEIVVSSVCYRFLSPYGT
jgi:hypothetical protein